MDSLPKRFNTPKSRMVIVAAYCFVSFLIGLCMTSRVSCLEQSHNRGMGWISIDTNLKKKYKQSKFVMRYICFWHIH